MPYSFSGIGTKFYGKEETDQSGVYLATEWIVFLYVPLVPIGSFRVRPREESAGAVPLKSQRSVIERVSLQWQHIYNVYAFIAAMAILAYLLADRRTALSNLFTGGLSSPSIPSTGPTPDPIPQNTPPPKPPYQRPTTDENGMPFPETSGYMKGYEQAFTDGRTQMTIDNTENDHDIYIKLYNLDMATPALASVFFVKANDKFTVESITPGSYELRYHNLDNGSYFRTEALTLKEEFDSERNMIVYDHLTVGLYGTIDGDMKTYPLTEEDFLEETEPLPVEGQPL